MKNPNVPTQGVFPTQTATSSTPVFDYSTRYPPAAGTARIPAIQVWRTSAGQVLRSRVEYGAQKPIRPVPKGAIVAPHPGSHLTYVTFDDDVTGQISLSRHPGRLI